MVVLRRRIPGMCPRRGWLRGEYRRRGTGIRLFVRVGRGNAVISEVRCAGYVRKWALGRSFWPVEVPDQHTIVTCACHPVRSGWMRRPLYVRRLPGGQLGQEARWCIRRFQIHNVQPLSSCQYDVATCCQGQAARKSIRLSARRVVTIFERSENGHHRSTHQGLDSCSQRAH